MNELPRLSAAVGWIGNWIAYVLQTHANTHKHSNRERYRFNSFHFIGFIQLAWPTTFLSDSPSTSAAYFSGRIWKSLFGSVLSLRRCLLVSVGSNFQTHHTGSTVILWMLRETGTKFYSIRCAPYRIYLELFRCQFIGIIYQIVRILYRLVASSERNSMLFWNSRGHSSQFGSFGYLTGQTTFNGNW